MICAWMRSGVHEQHESPTVVCASLGHHVGHSAGFLVITIRCKLCVPPQRCSMTYAIARGQHGSHIASSKLRPLLRQRGAWRFGADAIPQPFLPVAWACPVHVLTCVLWDPCTKQSRALQCALVKPMSGSSGDELPDYLPVSSEEDPPRLRPRPRRCRWRLTAVRRASTATPSALHPARAAKPAQPVLRQGLQGSIGPRSLLCLLERGGAALPGQAGAGQRRRRFPCSARAPTVEWQCLPAAGSQRRRLRPPFNPAGCRWRLRQAWCGWAER